ncbi:GlxA family transcriptional regulator [Leisingera sp. ANG-DT]|uniref:GlxA family transcriptional regulator n=1 Tax=Leisingera sp. ANG-DT TaxID=1577897 RepID=UPI0009DFF69D|nr:GlxA family transcriptional regulator [Leisingera sp. ANG-DT]
MAKLAQIEWKADHRQQDITQKMLVRNMNTLVPKGVAHMVLDGDLETEKFVFVLLPEFSMLSFSAAIEPLRMANQLTRKELFSWKILSADGLPVRASCGVPVGVDGALEETDRRARILVCSGGEPEENTPSKLAPWLRKQVRMGRPLGGLCTGAYALAHAGLLNGRPFALHWEHMPPFQEKYDHLIPVEQLFVMEPGLWTCGGGSASTDMMVEFIRQKFGSEVSRVVLDMCLHPAHRAAENPQCLSTSASIGSRNPKLLRVIEHFQNNLGNDLNMEAVARQSGMSRRHMERLFSQHLRVTPSKYLKDLRLMRARSILAETNLSISEVAAATGFETTTNFSRSFRGKYGVSPVLFAVGMQC